MRFGRACRKAVLPVVPLLAAGCLTVSPQEEVDLGRRYAAEIDRELPLIEARRVREPIEELGRSLARISSRPDLPWEFRVVNTDVVNAFAVPGGFIYVNRGLIEASRDMSEIAGVMAHEVAHVVARHSAEQIERARAAQLGLVGYSVLLGQPHGLEALGIDVGANLFFAKHSRDDETEADSLAVGLLVESGWHPAGLVSFFGTMLEEREGKPNALAALFASHPVTEERIRDVERLIAALPPEELEGLRRSSRAHDRLRAALERHPAPPEKYRVRD